MACLEFVRTLLGIDYVVRMLRILFTLLRHVRIMGVFFTHHSLTTVNREGIQGAKKVIKKLTKWLQIYATRDYREKITMVAARDTRKPRNARRGPEVRC